MSCLSKFVTMKHVKIGFMFSENVVPGILCPGKIKKCKVLLHQAAVGLSLNGHNTFIRKKDCWKTIEDT